MRLAPTLLLALVPATLAVSQTATTAAKKPVAHHTATSSTALPANIPKVVGVAKPLYALRYIDITPGTGPLAEPSVLGTSQADSKIMIYTVKYTGWLAKDGTKFDSSYDHPGAEPFPFPIGIRRVIPGWDTGFTGMHVGGKRRLFIPYQLAYGETGHPPTIPAKSDLIFDIELVKAEVAPQPTRQPAPQPAPAPDSTAKPAPDPTKPATDPATNDPAKATTPDTAIKPVPNPHSN